MPIIRTKKTRHYVVVSNRPFKGDMSLEAMGIYGFLMTKPDHWEITVAGLNSQLSKDNPNKITRALRELQDNGYIIREKKHDDKGLLKTTTTLYEYPQSTEQNNNRVRLSPSPEKTESGKVTVIVSTDLEVSTDNKVSTNTTKVVEPKVHGNPDISFIVKSFEEIFRIEQPKSERRAAQWFLKRFKKPDEIRAMFERVAQAQSQDKFCPTTPTLSAFYRKIPDLQAYFQRQEKNITIIDF